MMDKRIKIVNCSRGHQMLCREEDLIDANILNDTNCPCCKVINGEEILLHNDLLTRRDSLFVLDQEMFNGKINERIVSGDLNGINTVKYDSKKWLKIKNADKEEDITAYSLLKRFILDNQEMLHEKFRENDRYENFMIIKCDSCGNFNIHVKEDYSKSHFKCMCCGDIIPNDYYDEKIKYRRD